jgi:hypothetical protein
MHGRQEGENFLDINEGKEFEELLCRVVWGMEGGANFYLRGKSIQLTNTG